MVRRLRAGLGKSMRLIAVDRPRLGRRSALCLDAGFDDHLAKPVGLEAINRVLADAAPR